MISILLASQLILLTANAAPAETDPCLEIQKFSNNENEGMIERCKKSKEKKRIKASKKAQKTVKKKKIDGDEIKEGHP